MSDSTQPAAPSTSSAEESEAPSDHTPIVARTGALGYAERHPMIVAWIVLAIGMVAILLYTSKDVGLLPSQTLAMVLATIVLAGVCVWIITWD